MPGALNFQICPTFGTDHSVHNLAAKRFKLVSGYFSYDAASSSALTVTTALVGLNDIRGFLAANKGNVFWQFTPGTNLIQPVGMADASLTGTSLAAFTPTASFSVASITSVPFLCWGFE